MRLEPLIGLLMVSVVTTSCSPTTETAQWDDINYTKIYCKNNSKGCYAKGTGIASSVVGGFRGNP